MHHGLWKELQRIGDSCFGETLVDKIRDEIFYTFIDFGLNNYLRCLVSVSKIEFQFKENYPLVSQLNVLVNKILSST